MATNFPTEGDDLKISLRNSQYPQFDRDFAEQLSENRDIWSLGGNIRGNEAFDLWERALDGDEAGAVLDWIKEREAWAARHFGDGEQFAGGDLEPNRSNVGGIVAQIKWGVIGNLGETRMKEIMRELETKLEERELEVRPYPNEHAARLNDPAKYHHFRRAIDAGGDGIDFIYGLYSDESGEVKSEIQAIRFDAERFTEAEALEWLVSNEFEAIKFEPAIEGNSVEERHIASVQETDDEIIITYKKMHEDMNEAEDDLEDVIEDLLEEERLSKTEIVTRAEHGDMEKVDDRRVRMSISSEREVERAFGREVIVHSRETLNLEFLQSGRAPLLKDHDPEQQIGVVESVELDGSARRLRATVRFSKSALAEEIYQDVIDGIRSNVSIGYKVRKMERDTKQADLFRVTDAEIMEVSIVSLPADPSVGVGRSVEVSENATIKTIDKEIPIMENQIDMDSVRAEIAAEKSKEISEILSLAAKHNQRNFADDAIRQGMSLAQFRGALLDKIADKPLDVSSVDLSAKERAQYSLTNAIRNAAAGRFGGLEAEVSQELAKRYGKEPRGFYVPTNIFKRDITTASPANGSNLVPTDHLAGEFIDALRANLVISGLGARMMQGLTGDVAIPALNAKTSVGFVAENNAPGSEGAPSFRQVTMSPKTLVQHVDIGRKLMMQSDPSVEQIIRDDMTRQFAAKIDEVAIEGGGANEPTGILGTNGIGSVALGTNGGAITFASLVDLEREVAIDNALAGNLAYLTNPKVVAAMRQTPRQSSGVEGNFILNDSNTVLGYNVASTTLVPSDLTKGTSSGVCSAVIFGNYSDLMIGMFGGLDVLIDPYSLSTTGAVRVAMYQDVDVAVRHAESFAAIKDVTTA